MARLLNPDPTFWRGKRVFLTGHTGFKGTWLALWLERLGASVVGYALPADTSPALFTLANQENLRNVFADIRDGTRLAAEMATAAPDIVLHLAAQSLVQRSYREPAATIETNVLGTVHLLEAMRRTPSARCAVIITSDKCYENREWVWAYREDEPLGGFDPYSASKACAELITAAWRRSFFRSTPPAAIASARAGNVIGGGDWAENRLLPDCIRALTRGEPIGIRNPAARRPWQHVLEPLSGYLLLAERLWRDGIEAAEAWNFGPSAEESIPVSKIADLVVTIWGEGASWRPLQTRQSHEAHLLAVDAAKARARLGWSPRLRVAEAVEWTVRWHRRYREGAAAEALILDDIARYELTGTTTP